MRDLKRNFKDPEFEDVISKCTDDGSSKRPSSFTLIELAASRLSQITNQPSRNAKQFLPNTYGQSRYLFQAILETLDRFFTTYQAAKSHRIHETASRLRLLIDDSGDSETNTLKALNLDTSPHLALILGDLDKAKNLIRSGHTASTGSWETCGFSSLHIGCREAYSDVVECWLKCSLEVDAQDDRGRTALHWAVLSGSEAICDMLLQANAGLDIADNEGATAMHKAAEREDVQILQKMLDRGANVEAKDKEGATPLHRASSNGWDKAVHALLQSGADPFVVDKEGFTPEQSAYANGFRELGDLLSLRRPAAKVKVQS